MCHLEMHVMWLRWWLLLTSSWHLLLLFWRLFPFTCYVEAVCDCCSQFSGHLDFRFVLCSYSRQCCFPYSLVTGNLHRLHSCISPGIHVHRWPLVTECGSEWTWLYGNATGVVQCQDVHHATALLPLVCFRMSLRHMLGNYECDPCHVLRAVGYLICPYANSKIMVPSCLFV